MYCDCKAAQGTIHDLKMNLTKLLQPCNKYLNHKLWKTIWYSQIAQSYSVLIVFFIKKFLSDLLLPFALLQLLYFDYKKNPKKKQNKQTKKFKLLEFAFACADLFSQGTDIPLAPGSESTGCFNL